MKNTAIVLAGGRGSRMKSEVKKQYLMLGDRPVLWYSLHVLEQCARIDEVILVCGKGEVGQCREIYVRQYGFSKVKKVVEGGKERYHSVYEGLKVADGCDYVLIHDGARPFIDEAMLNRILDVLPDCQACAVGMQVKDTIKMGNPEGYVEQTLPRERLWAVQTPQSFSYPLIRKAYDTLICRDDSEINITDDAMVAEYILHIPVKLIPGSYNNIKITTPEDLIIAEALLPFYR